METFIKSISSSQIKQVEGIQGYFKGLGPNLVGVIPAR
jgi:solute carrier family 25 protein 33/36